MRGVLHQETLSHIRDPHGKALALCWSCLEHEFSKVARGRVTRTHPCEKESKEPCGSRDPHASLSVLCSSLEKHSSGCVTLKITEGRRACAEAACSAAELPPPPEHPSVPGQAGHTGMTPCLSLQTPHLVNLNEDPLMSECLLYYIKDGITR